MPVYIVREAWNAVIWALWVSEQNVGWGGLDGWIVGYPLNFLTTGAPAAPIKISHLILLFRRPVHPLAVHEAGPGEAERGVQEENNHRNFSRRPAGEILLLELPCRSGKMRSSIFIYREVFLTGPP